MVSRKRSQAVLLGPPQVSAPVARSGPPRQLTEVVEPETVPEEGVAAARGLAASARIGAKVTADTRHTLSTLRVKGFIPLSLSNLSSK
jgi:hypothetical protein